jgi:hypothetical protein
MINASRTLSPASLGPAIIRRRPPRPLLLAPPSAFAKPLPAIAPADEPAWSDWRDDLRFFLGCYAAGLAFFLIMLS